MKFLDEMTEVELADVMNAAGRAVQSSLPEGTGWIILASPFGGKVAQYVSNVERKSAQGWMLETLLRWTLKDCVER